MAYNRDNIQKVKELLAARRSEAVSTSMRRKAEMEAKIPGYGELEEALAGTGARIMQAAFSHALDDATVAAIREDNRLLREKKGALLQRYGYPADYTDIQYTCEACSDTGYRGIEMCSCMRKELIRAGVESAGLASLIKTQNFETFSLDFYENHDRIIMENNVRRLRQYAESFSADTADSWLFAGATGLGKTHLSTAVAGVVISRGFDVIYDSVQEILAVYEEDRFSHGEGIQHQRGRTVESLLECDLLIMDDLGTELTNQFTVSSLYSMINTRINRGKSTIINTNLTQSEIRSRYTDRIASRLFGEYKPLLFKGVDVRAQKLRK
ncbi:MAG: ATP-binding protein [Clostridia bacterium]|nr:ATP-binding protein [Clostridia bacterium]